MSQFEWITEKLGTGAMIKHLKSGTADVVVALTEGLIKDIVTTGSDIRLLGTYVNSPLCWVSKTLAAGSIQLAAVHRSLLCAARCRQYTTRCSMLQSGCVCVYLSLSIT